MTIERIPDINKIIKGEICLQAFDAKTGEFRREARGKNHITRRGLLEMIVQYLTTKEGKITDGAWALYNSTSRQALPLVTLFSTIDDLPANCGTSLRDTRVNLFLLGDNAPAESYDTMYEFTNLLFGHNMTNNRNGGSDTWDAGTLKLNLSWSYGAADWDGEVNSIIMGSDANGLLTSPVHACHRVVLAQPFVKLDTENAVLNWTWTIALPAV